VEEKEKEEKEKRKKKRLSSLRVPLNLSTRLAS